jgi:hypothetical protein
MGKQRSSKRNNLPQQGKNINRAPKSKRISDIIARHFQAMPAWLRVSTKLVGGFSILAIGYLYFSRSGMASQPEIVEGLGTSVERLESVCKQRLFGMRRNQMFDRVDYDFATGCMKDVFSRDDASVMREFQKVADVGRVLKASPAYTEALFRSDISAHPGLGSDPVQLFHAFSLSRQLRYSLDHEVANCGVQSTLLLGVSLSPMQKD